MEDKKNCWEIKLCGRQPNGDKVKEMGICPAATDTTCHGINGGTNGGRICWVLSGTFCGGKVQGTFAQKQTTCMACDFMHLVKREEAIAFKAFKGRV